MCVFVYVNWWAKLYCDIAWFVLSMCIIFLFLFCCCFWFHWCCCFIRIEWNHNAFPSTLFIIIGWRLSCRCYTFFSHWFLFIWINYKRAKGNRNMYRVYIHLYTGTDQMAFWNGEIASDRNKDTDLKLIYSIYFTIVTSELPSKLPKAFSGQFVFMSV